MKRLAILSALAYSAGVLASTPIIAGVRLLVRRYAEFDPAELERHIEEMAGMMLDNDDATG